MCLFACVHVRMYLVLRMFPCACVGLGIYDRTDLRIGERPVANQSRRAQMQFHGAVFVFVGVGQCVSYRLHVYAMIVINALILIVTWTVALNYHRNSRECGEAYMYHL